MLYKVRWKAATKEAFVLPNANANPAGTTAITGTFNHFDDASDNLDVAESHVLYHHVRDLLYAADIEDMGSVSIVIVPTTLTLYPATKTIDLSNAETLQLTWELTPSTGSNQTVTFASSDATKATVNSAGLVTPVAAGETTITATHTLSGKTDTCVVTVQA